MPVHKYCIGAAVPRPTAVPEIVRAFCVEGRGGHINYLLSGGHAVDLSGGSIQVTVGGRLSQPLLGSIPCCVGGFSGEFPVSYHHRGIPYLGQYVVNKRQHY